MNLHILLDNQRKCTLKISLSCLKRIAGKRGIQQNEVLKSKNKKHMVNDKCITSEGTSCTHKNEIVEQFNKYFTHTGSCINYALAKTGEDPTQHIKHNTASFFLCTH